MLTQTESLEQAVREHPRDQTLRQCLIDELIEHGDFTSISLAILHANILVLQDMPNNDYRLLYASLLEMQGVVMFALCVMATTRRMRRVR